MTLQNNKEQLIKLGQAVDEQWLISEINRCIAKLKINMKRFGNQFPSACGTNGVYRIKPNDDWTNGFWTGMLWLAYEWTNEDVFLEQAMENIKSFQERLDNHFVLDHHDIGFLYSLSAGAGFQLTEKEVCRTQLIQAADVLLARFQPKGNFIQAWGTYGDPKEYRLIIDSLINLPLLFKATELTGDRKYQEVAEKHYHTLINTVIREDGTTFHTYYFNHETGLPSHGATHQGNGDQSIWARGQSWGVLGIPLIESLLGNTDMPQIYQTVVDVFIENLPKDLVPYWDFDFNDEHPSDKDSSSLAVVACGLLEASHVDGYSEAKALAKGMIYQLGEHYATTLEEVNEGLLAHGVYAHAEGKGIDEPNLWGDYFYFEALMRLANDNWKKYW